MKHLIIFLVVTGGVLFAIGGVGFHALLLAAALGAFATFCFEMSRMFADQNRRIREQRERHSHR